MKELQLDGLVGPSHHYAGLSSGNLACTANAHEVSNPQEAALQGLAKMRYVAGLGVPQMVMPPVMHDVFGLLRRYGFAGNERAMLENAYKTAPNLLASVFSASSMWTANAATVTPSCDSQNRKVQFTPANLVSKLHRVNEVKCTNSLLKQLFPDSELFYHHDPLIATAGLSDEGAANHMRLSCDGKGAQGIHLFVYGIEEGQAIDNKRYFPRQHKEACLMIARQHGWHEGEYAMLKQTARAVDAGVFHNDVIAMSAGNFMAYHEAAYAPEASEILHEFKRKHKSESLHFRMVSEAELSLEDTVKTYFFNSQLLQIDNAIQVIAPSECEENPAARALFDRLLQEENPISKVTYLDLRESMKNGGGPACLRLRVPLNERELAAAHQPAMLDAALYERLYSWVKEHYRDRLNLADFQEVSIVEEMQKALSELAEILQLRNYPQP